MTMISMMTMMVFLSILIAVTAAADTATATKLLSKISHTGNNSNQTNSSSSGSSTVTVTVTPSIVGGSPTVGGEYPAFAFIDGIGCGGTLIHSDVVLSAAHCFVGGRSAIGNDVYLGSTKRDGSDAIETIPIRQVRTHPDYRIYAFSDALTNSVNIPYTVENADYDYVLLLLSEISTKVTPIPYNINPAVPLDNTELITIGYGLTTQDGTLSSNLLQVNVISVNMNTCAEAYNDEIDRVSSMCAAAPGKDSCNGDSGGPLLLRNTTTTTQQEQLTIVGIVSGGIGCAQRTFPGIYSRVSTVANDFIRIGICEMSNDPPSDCLGDNTSVCPQCFKNMWLGRRFGLGTQMYLLRSSSPNNDNTCEERCHYRWLVWYWKLLGWKCGDTCPSVVSRKA